MYVGHPGRGLGALELQQEELLALGTLFGGLVGALGVYFFATGRQREAAMIGVSTGIVGAFIGAARVLNKPPSGDVVVEMTGPAVPQQQFPWTSAGLP